MFDRNIELNNGVKIPQLGLGTWFIDDDKVADAVKAAVEIGARKLLPEKYCAKPSFGAPIGNTISFACARIASSSYGKSPSPVSHTSFARLKTAHAFGHPA